MKTLKLKRQYLEVPTSSLIIVLTIMTIADLCNLRLFSDLLPWVCLVTLISASVGASKSSRMFLYTSIALTLLVVYANPDWLNVFKEGLTTAAFIAAFYTSLGTLRSVADTSSSIIAAGTYLASQPPGRRYAVLTLGSHLFSLVLSYGAISLLGGLATSIAKAEPDSYIRELRTRRMLLAVQRGFVASLAWSPLGVCMALINTQIEGAKWANSVAPGLVSAALVLTVGWVLDSLLNPRRAQSAPRVAPLYNWRVLNPLFLLLICLAVVVGSLYLLTGFEVIAIVLAVVPIISILWVVKHAKAGPPSPSISSSVSRFFLYELPKSNSQIVLLGMASYIGIVGAALLKPVVSNAGFDPSLIPSWLLLLCGVWALPILGQLGMNPLLSFSLLAPFIPDPAILNVSPAAVVTSFAAGWVLCTASSPFTANNQLLGSMGGVSAWRVALGWNGLYASIAGVICSCWVFIYAYVLS